MKKRILQYFLVNYENKDYLQKTRARLLLYFELAFILFTVMLQFSMLFAGWFDFVVTIPMTSIMFTGLITALVFLRKGRYSLSAKIFIAFGAAAVLAGLIRQPFQEIELSYTSYIYFVYPIIVLCAIFSTPRFLTVISLVSAGASVILFIIMRTLSTPEMGKMIIIAFNNSLFSILFLYLISMLIIKVFERSMELAMQESEKNMKTNQFIKQVLKENSSEIVAEMQTMSSKSDEFSENTHDQSAALEEISATVEEISAGIDHVSMIAEEQAVSLSDLVKVLDELSSAIQDIDRAINESLLTAGTITEKAQSGEQYLRVMEEGIGNVRISSQEMSAIIGMIGDISDKINLLSLNAAIEAARAGDAGRGFAVVADEISKLADDTDSSLKAISNLIKTNENEIERGLSGVTMAVNITKDIIEGISAINGRIRQLSGYTEKQMATNNLVNRNALDLRQRAEEISAATSSQKQSVSEIANNIGMISEHSQNTTAYAVKIAYDSQNMVELVTQLKKTIDEYED